MSTTVNPHAFAGMLTDVARTADGGWQGLPMLSGILLHTDKVEKRTVLVATSTDRFSLSQAHIESTGKLPQVFIPLDEVKRVLAVLKAAGKDAQLLQIRPAKEAVTFDVSGKVSVTVETGDAGGWPNGIAKLFKPADGPLTDPVLLNPTYLARFTTIASRRKESMLVEAQSPNRPIHVFIGEDFRGLIMPMRPVEDGAAFAPVFAPEQAKAAAA